MRMPLEIMHLNKTPCDSVPNSKHAVVKKETLIIKHEEFKAIKGWENLNAIHILMNLMLKKSASK